MLATATSVSAGDAEPRSRQLAGRPASRRRPSRAPRRSRPWRWTRRGRGRTSGRDLSSMTISHRATRSCVGARMSRASAARWESHARTNPTPRDSAPSVAALLAASSARAQDPTGGGAPPAPDAGDRDAVTPPSLKAHPDAVYPPDALRDRIEGSVGLEITIDERGAVVDARVTQPAGHGFDEAALAAVRQWTFEPARAAAGRCARSWSSRFRSCFPLRSSRPPGLQRRRRPRPPGPSPASSIAPAAAPAVSQPGATTVVLGRKPISAASSLSVRDRDFSLRPVDSVQDILRVTPGLVMVQHSGGGKANQYFLRGFDADHGTDIALSIDGIPINMVSHAHGQGYADTNFIIPETVERVEITKGTYFASQGDFATAGAVNLVTRDDFEHSSVGFGGSGSPGHGAPSYRGLLIASPKFDGAKAIFAAEIGRQNGPFDNPEGWDHYKLFNKVTFAIAPASSITLGESSYSGELERIRADPGARGRARESSTASGRSTRAKAATPRATSSSSATSCGPPSAATSRRWRMSARTGSISSRTSRFTWRTPCTATRSSRSTGARSTAARCRTGSSTTSRACGSTRPWARDVRSDDIHEELWHTAERVELNQLRGNDVHETMLGAYLNEEITPFRSLRFDLGGRADMLSFAVDNTLVTTDPTNPRSGVGDAHQFSPKASAVLTPLDREERAARPLHQLGQRLSLERRARRLHHAVGDAPDARHRRRRSARAPGSCNARLRGHRLATRSRQRDDVGRRRRDDRGRPRHAPLRRRIRDALRAHPVARGRRRT